MKVKQTAGRDTLGEFAPAFAALNDDVLFGQVWNREEQLSLRDRSMVTVVAQWRRDWWTNRFVTTLPRRKRTA